MDSDRFDALVKHLSVLSTRRHGLRAILATAIATAISFVGPDEAAACKGRGDPCKKDGQCCSGRCKDRRFGKRKRKRKCKRCGKRHRRGRRATCQCSQLQKRCNVAKDCCTGTCGDNACGAAEVCCQPPGAFCFDDCDCCFDVACGEDGRCEACRQTQEACERTSQCCQNDEICDTIDPACNPAGAKVCCGTPGSDCLNDCDCCQPFECDELRGECVAPSCHEPGVDCDIEDDACCAPTVCAPIDCDGQTVTGCCFFDGDGPCFHDCDCCGDLVCRDEVCVRAVSCSSSEVTCPQNSKKECCPAEFPVCCQPDDFEACCPEGSSCGQFGCITDTPNVCPANADICDARPGPLVFCAGPPRTSPLDCSCRLDMAGNSVCTTGASCIECTTDADCHAPPQRPNWICIDCPNPMCGHTKGVCAGPCFAPE